jgi:hypothetical protein
MTGKYNRRIFFKRYLSISFGFLGGGLIILSCDAKKNTTRDEHSVNFNIPCNDLSGLSENDLKIRENLGYVHESPIPDNKCNNCNLWIPPVTEHVCGGCMLFKGPVNSTGYCTYWAPQV